MANGLSEEGARYDYDDRVTPNAHRGFARWRGLALVAAAPLSAPSPPTLTPTTAEWTRPRTYEVTPRVLEYYCYGFSDDFTLPSGR